MDYIQYGLSCLYHFVETCARIVSKNRKSSAQFPIIKVTSGAANKFAQCIDLEWHSVVSFTTIYLLTVSAYVYCCKLTVYDQN